MDRKKAIDLLMALAVCSVVKLSCEECPLLGERQEESHYCQAWTEEKIAEAFKFLKENPGTWINIDTNECWACARYNQQEGKCDTWCDHGECFELHPVLKNAPKEE